MRVLLDPSEARLEASDLQADQAVENFLDRVVKYGATERVVERGAHLIYERVEGVVDSRRTGVHPAEDVVVNLAVQVTDGAVDAVRP